MTTILLRSHLAAALLHGLLTLSAIISTHKKTESVLIFDSLPQWNYTNCRSTFGESSVGICPHTCPDGDDYVSKVIGEVNMTAVLITSQLFTCMAHCLQVFLLYKNNSTYREFTNRGIKLLFWLEYVVTGSAVAYVVIYYSGNIELKSQLVSILSQATLMLLGLLLDLTRCLYVVCQRHSVFGNWELKVLRYLCVLIFSVGFANVMTVWGPSIYELAKSDTGAPAWVLYVVLLECLLYISFGVTQLLFFTPFILCGDPPSLHIIVGENISLIVLSFVSKAILNTFFSMCLVYGVCQDQ